ncbi:MFS transporter [Botrimarina sp.]|uniref:MFS transporter n=1 Tax=Botrimarina sp. TaxID=2795802 RepID=UPI0032EAE1FC
MEDDTKATPAPTPDVNGRATAGTTDPGVSGATAPVEPKGPPSRSAWRYAWAWVPSLYFAEGVPFLIVMSLAGDLYVQLGVDNDTMARATSLLYLPWVIKPLWSPFVEVFGKQRWWIAGTQALVAVALGLAAWVLPGASFFSATLALFWVIAFASATHDIAADGFYIDALPDRAQAWFVGLRSTFYRLSMIFVTGGMLQAAGVLDNQMEKPLAWAWTFAGAAVLFGAFALYHALALPRLPKETAASLAGGAPGAPRENRLASVASQVRDTIVSFFQKPGIVPAIVFLLLYRFSEGQLTKLAKPFLFAPRSEGGMALEVETVGVIYGYVGVGMLTLGGILGGMAAAKGGLRRWLLPMALAMNLPNALYALLAAWTPDSYWLVTGVVAAEQFGYGFGFAAYLLYMIHIARGEHSTAHYSICTGFMALGMAIPGFISGDIQRELGYFWFFVWVVVATIPSLLVTAYIARTVPEDAFAEG